MLDRVRAEIKKHNMLKYGDRVVIGVSGGADSVCLTDVLNCLKAEYSLSITLVHVNHNIRGEDAKRDEAFVKKLAEKYGNDIEIFSFPVEKMAAEEGSTVEETGRRLRYESFYKAAGSEGKIAVAHNINDNCETMLMRFFRGTGIKGLKGIAPVRDNIIRPLISVSRDEIEKYCADNKLSYCTDYTNELEEYTRNKIRLSLIPLIKKEFNENIVNTLYRTSELMSEEDRFLEEEAKKAYACCETEPSRIAIDRLSEYDKVIQRRVIRLGFIGFSPDLHDISYQHVEKVLSLTESKSGKIAELPHGLRAAREHDTIFFYREEEKISLNIVLEKEKSYEIKELFLGVMLSEYNMTKKVKNLCTLKLDYAKIKGEPVLRYRCEGDKISLPFGTKSLKKLFIDEKIPLSKRSLIPIVALDNEVIWIKDLKYSSYFKAGENSKVLYFYTWEV